VGALPKTRVRELAAELGLVNARKPDSQDICFVPDGDYAGFIERAAPEPSPPGDFVDMSGRVLGRHRGIIHYTIGQRRGLGIAAPEPLYVRAIDAASNTVTLGGARDVYFNALLVRGLNLIAAPRIDGTMRLAVKVRYSQPEQPALVWQTDEDTLRVEFERPQRAPARGQAAVLYDGEYVFGGGTIEEVL
jgi:tRNA-specific 2-thiouridylase